MFSTLKEHQEGQCYQSEGTKGSRRLSGNKLIQKVSRDVKQAFGYMRLEALEKESNSEQKLETITVHMMFKQ